MTAFSAAAGVLLLMVGSGSLVEAFFLLYYYTIQTNLMVLAVIVASRLPSLQNRRWLADLLHSVTIWITVTALGYHIFLSGLYQPTGLEWLGNILTHYLTPVLMLLCFFMTSAGRRKGPLFWLSYPFIYVSMVMIRGGLIDGHYPYWFLRPYGSFPEGMGSYGNVVLLLLVFALFLVAYGLMLSFLRSFLRKGLVRIRRQEKLGQSAPALADHEPVHQGRSGSQRKQRHQNEHPQ